MAAGGGGFKCTDGYSGVQCSECAKGQFYWKGESRLRRVPLAPSTAYPTYGAEGHTRRYAYRRDLLKEPSWLLLLGVLYRECVQADSPRPFCAFIHAPTHTHAHPLRLPAAAAAAARSGAA